MDEFFLSIAGFRIAVHLHTSESEYTKKWYVDHINTYYKAFIIGKPKRIDFHMHFVWDISQEIIIRKKEGKYFLKFYRRLRNNEFETYYTISPFQFDTLLREIIYELLRKYTGFLLHASAVGVGSKAYLFLGSSGAGKSTSVKLLKKGFEPLADEAVILKEENGRFFIYQTPFIEKEPWIWKYNRKYDLDKIFFLQKATYFMNERLSNHEEIIHRFLQQIYFPSEDLAIQMDYIDRFMKVFKEFYLLKFAKNEKKMLAHFTKQQDEV